MGRRFSITVKGRMGAGFSSAFDEVAIRHSGPTTVISGYACDQTYLDGILAHLRDLGLEVIGLQTRATHAPQAPSDSPPRTATHDERRRR